VYELAEVSAVEWSPRKDLMGLFTYPLEKI